VNANKSIRIRSSPNVGQQLFRAGFDAPPSRLTHYVVVF
jgi:hypothetical protein